LKHVLLKNVPSTENLNVTHL